MFIFYGSVLMLRETRMATATVNAEMDFTWELARKVAPKEIASKYSRKGKNKGMATAKLRAVDAKYLTLLAENRLEKRVQALEALLASCTVCQKIAATIG